MTPVTAATRAPRAGPAVTVTAHGIGAGATVTGDTTGADLVVVHVAFNRYYGPASLADGRGNAWTPLTPQGQSNGYTSQLFYAAGPSLSVGAGHTFTAAPDAGAVVAFLALGGAAAAPFQAESGALVDYGAVTMQPGALTPSADGALLVAGFVHGSATALSVDSGYTLLDLLRPTTTPAAALAWLAQAAAAAADPTFAWPEHDYGGVTAAVFLAAPAAPGGGAGVVYPLAVYPEAVYPAAVYPHAVYPRG